MVIVNKVYIQPGPDTVKETIVKLMEAPWKPVWRLGLVKMQVLL